MLTALKGRAKVSSTLRVDLFRAFETFEAKPTSRRIPGCSPRFRRYMMRR